VLGAHLAHGLASSAPLDDLAAPVAKALAATATELDLARSTTPASTITICRLVADSWRLYLLGDSPAVVLRHDGTVQVHTDERLGARTEDFRRTYEQRLAAGHGFDDVHVGLVREMQEFQYAVRNTDRGYWIAADDPRAADHGLRVEIPVAGTAAILLCSDGAFEPLSRLTGPFAWADLADADDDRLASLLVQAHEFEVDDAAAIAYPRAKPHDDKTLLLLRPSSA
jgi:serine/threonine protein phosphatase PrpC